MISFFYFLRSFLSLFLNNNSCYQSPLLVENKFKTYCNKPKPKYYNIIWNTK